jgi:hypothetical protein
MYTRLFLVPLEMFHLHDYPGKKRSLNVITTFCSFLLANLLPLISCIFIDTVSSPQVLTVEGAPKRKLRNMVLEATRYAFVSYATSLGQCHWLFFALFCISWFWLTSSPQLTLVDALGMPIWFNQFKLTLFIIALFTPFFLFSPI